MPGNEIKIFSPLPLEIPIFRALSGTLTVDDDNRFKTLTDERTGACTVIGSAYAGNHLKFQRGTVPTTTAYETAHILNSDGEEEGFVTVLGEGDASHLTPGTDEFIPSHGPIAYVAAAAVELTYHQLLRYQSPEQLHKAIEKHKLTKFVASQIDPEKSKNNETLENTRLIAFRVFQTEQGIRLVGFIIGPGAILAYNPIRRECYPLHPISLPLKGQIPYLPGFPSAYKPHHVQLIDVKLPPNSLIFTLSAEVIRHFTTPVDGFKKKYKEEESEFYYTFPYNHEKLRKCLIDIDENKTGAIKDYLFSMLKTVTQTLQTHLDEQPCDDYEKEEKIKELQETISGPETELYKLHSQLDELMKILPFYKTEPRQPANTLTTDERKERERKIDLNNFTRNEITALRRRIKEIKEDKTLPANRKALKELEVPLMASIHGDLFISGIPVPQYPKIKLVQNLIQVAILDKKSPNDYQNLLDQIQKQIHPQELHSLFADLVQMEKKDESPLYSNENLGRAQWLIYQAFKQHQNKSTPPERRIFKEEVKDETLNSFRKLRIFFREMKPKNPGFFNRQGELKAVKTRGPEQTTTKTLWMTYEQYQRFSFFKDFVKKKDQYKNTNGEYENCKAILETSKERSREFVQNFNFRK